MKKSRAFRARTVSQDWIPRRGFLQSLSRRLRIYHDGHSEARLGLQHSARFNAVKCVACDGTRQRFLYQPNRTGLQTATIYLRKPSVLYSLVKPRWGEDTKTQLCLRELKPDFIVGVNPVRSLEWTMLDHGGAYDHGIIGAETAYSIASKMLMTDHLLMPEPAMRGAGLVSEDRSIAIGPGCQGPRRSRTNRLQGFYVRRRSNTDLSNHCCEFSLDASILLATRDAYL